MNFFVQILQNLFGAQQLAALSAEIRPLIMLIGTTPLNLTTANDAVDGTWMIFAGVADSLLVLFVVVGAIQMMYGSSVGSLQMPISQFLGKAFLTGILIHLSLIFSQDLVLLNNELCMAVQFDIQQFIMQINNGLAASQGQVVVLSILLTVLFGIGLIRVIFQAIKRIAMIDLFFVIGPLAYVLSFHPVTMPMFSFWGRTFVVTIFTQFLQFLVIGLGIKVLVASNQASLTTVVIAAAILNLSAEIPGLLARFAATPSTNASGIATVVRTAITAATILA